MLLNAGSRKALLPPARAAALSGEPQQEQKQGQEVEGVRIRIRPAQQRGRKRAQWSTGTAPGEYGGPPFDLKPTRMWGGSKADPLGSNDDYIWKKDWQPHVLVEAQDEQGKEVVEMEDSGFLSLNRALSLDSMDVDLSKELLKPSRATLERQVQAAREAVALSEQRAKSGSKPAWNFVPTRREEVQWARAKKAATGGSEVLKRQQVDSLQAADMARERYVELKDDLVKLTLGIGGACTATVWLSYSSEVAASYSLGLLGSVVYVRMLANSVDSVGGAGLQSAMKSAGGQPRLLVPVALVMLYNRWNVLLAPQYDLLHLQLIPMLIGFFTYKAATLIHTFRELLPSQTSPRE